MTWYGESSLTRLPGDRRLLLRFGRTRSERMWIYVAGCEPFIIRQITDGLFDGPVIGGGVQWRDWIAMAGWWRHPAASEPPPSDDEPLDPDGPVWLADADADATP